MIEPTWNEPDPTILDNITQHGCFAADSAVIGAGAATGAERTRIAVRAALRVLLANGFITVAPQTEWPDWVTLDPPEEEPRGS